MKTAPSDYGTWRPVAADGDANDDQDPFLTAKSAGINDNEPLVGHAKHTASTLQKALYVALLVLFGSGMTLIISAQDRYCIENCPGRNETFHYPETVGLCAAAHAWEVKYTEDCNNGLDVPAWHPAPTPTDAPTETPTPEPSTATSWTAAARSALRQLSAAMPWASASAEQDANGPVYFLSTRTPYMYAASASAGSDEEYHCEDYCASLPLEPLQYNGTSNVRYPNEQYENCIKGCCAPHAFHQPFIQLLQMGCGQVLTGLSFPLYKHTPGPDGQLMGDPSFRQFAPKAALASLFDALAEVFIILGLGLTAPATAEMMKATLVIFTGLVSTWFFKDFKLTWKQWVATGVMLAGASLVIAQEYIYVDECSLEEGKAGPLEEVVGALFTIIAQVFYALQFITEESLIDENKVRNQHVNKALLVFCEGIVSILAAIILQVPFTYTSVEDQWAGFADDFITYFTDPVLFGMGIGLSACVAGFDIWGLLTAEHMGSDLRAVVCASFQVVLVWTVSLLVPHFGESFNPIALVGFIVILAAGLFYSYTAQGKEDPRSKERLLSESP